MASWFGREVERNRRQSVFVVCFHQAILKTSSRQRATGPCTCSRLFFHCRYSLDIVNRHRPANKGSQTHDNHQRQRMSPPTTPPSLIASSPLGRAASQTPSNAGSDESALFELSFDYEVDPQGRIIRTNKRPSGSRHPHSLHSNSSSPPTPVSESQEGSPLGRFSGEGRDGRATPDFSDGSPIPHAAKSRRASLSRSESMPGPTTATSSNLIADRPEEYSRPLSTEPSASNSRHFQRVASTPLPSNFQSGSGIVSGAGTSSRIGASSKYSRPMRVSQEQYNEALRQEEYRWPDEKENLDDADFPHQYQHQPYEPPATISARRSPPPPSLPVATNGRRSSPPRSDVPTYNYSRPTATSQSHVTPAGPQRAYLASGSSITPGGSGVRAAGAGSTASRMLKKKLTTGFGVSRISEVDTPPSSMPMKDMEYDYAAEGIMTDGEAPSPMDTNGNGWQSDVGGYAAAAAARVVGRQRAPSASAAVTTANTSPKGLAGSSSVRPRRSASLSEGNSKCSVSPLFSSRLFFPLCGDSFFRGSG